VSSQGNFLLRRSAFFEIAMLLCAFAQLSLCPTPSQMLAFLEEFYHEDRDRPRSGRLVFLHPAEPDASKKSILDDVRFTQKVSSLALFHNVSLSRAAALCRVSSDPVCSRYSFIASGPTASAYSIPTSLDLLHAC
jgi:hypothetical protein